MSADVTCSLCGKISNSLVNYRGERVCLACATENYHEVQDAERREYDKEEANWQKSLNWIIQLGGFPALITAWIKKPKWKRRRD